MHSVSMVNEMLVLIELNVSWKAETSSFPMMQKLSSTYPFQILGGTGELLIADSSISSIQRLATAGLTGLPIVFLRSPRTNGSWYYIGETDRAFNTPQKRTFQKHQNCGQWF